MIIYVRRITHNVIYMLPANQHLDFQAKNSGEMRSLKHAMYQLHVPLSTYQFKAMSCFKKIKPIMFAIINLHLPEDIS